ncbi:MAG: AAA family ATPase, partial [Mariprofundales bacterium]|nr:AAA family ATPase [Mariprofundales bacterium]
RSVNFRHVVLIMTSNVGAVDMERATVGFTPQSRLHASGDALKETFTPEFRNRLDASITFAPLSPVTILHVVDKFLMELEEQLIEKRVELIISPDARRWLADNGYDPKMGARPMSRLIHSEIKRPLADEILFGSLSRGGQVEIVCNSSGEGLRLHYPQSALVEV